MQTSVGVDTHAVTVCISVKAKQGHEKELEGWLEGVGRAASQFAGHQGLTVLRPSGSAAADYVYIFRFDTYAHLKQWEDFRGASPVGRAIASPDSRGSQETGADRIGILVYLAWCSHHASASTLQDDDRHPARHLSSKHMPLTPACPFPWFFASPGAGSARNGRSRRLDDIRRHARHDAPLRSLAVSIEAEDSTTERILP